jgi:hypothetical protein
MPHGGHNAERRTAKRRGHLGDDFLEGVFFGAVAAREIAIEPGGMPAGVRQLMQRGPVPVDRLEIGSRSRHLNVVVARTVEGPVAPNTEVDPDRTDQRFDLRLNYMRRRGDAGGIGG